MSGKGDTPRPLSVDPETYAERYARTFGHGLREMREQMQQPLLDKAHELLRQQWPQRDTLPTTDPED